jgi:hypothetical protein
MGLSLLRPVRHTGFVREIWGNSQAEQWPNHFASILVFGCENRRSKPQDVSLPGVVAALMIPQSDQKLGTPSCVRHANFS